MKFSRKYPTYGYGSLSIPLFVGQINIKPKSGMYFSERYGYRPCVVIFGICFTWIKWQDVPYIKEIDLGEAKKKEGIEE